MSMELAARSSEQVLRDLKTVLQQIPASLYAKPIGVMYSASVGQHVRHILEFYTCLEQQLESGRVDYDLRKRNLVLERFPEAAVEAVDEICGWLEKVAQQTDITLQLVVNYDCENGKNKEDIASSLKRELIFNIEHAIHHAALVKVGLHLLAPEIILPAHFGVAPSTVRYHRHNDLPNAVSE